MKKSIPILFAILAALFYSVNAPLAKVLLSDMDSTMMAALLYLGAGVGMLILSLVRKVRGGEGMETSLTKKDLPYTAAMIVLDIAAPISLMAGLATTNSESVSLLNNFEIVATSLIALLIFKERIRLRLAFAIVLITIASMLLSFEDISSLSFSPGSILTLLASVFWGFENNCTRMLSKKDPLEIVMVKGFGSGLGALLVALILGCRLPSLNAALASLALGFVSYGLSIFFYVYAQRYLGASKTSAYYAISPFLGVLLSLLIFKEIPDASFWIALAIMAVGTYLTTTS